MKINEEQSLLHYTITGDGPLVILLHGLLMEGESWLSNGLVDALRSDFTVICPDLPAHGKSQDVINSGYDQQSQAEKIKDIIAHSGFRKAHIIGYSSGAWLASGLVKYHPDRLSSLVIGGWDVRNGLPEGPDGRLDFDAFFTFAQATAPELTHWVTAANTPPLRACFNALAGYDGIKDSRLVSEINIPKLFWAGTDDIYYPPLKAWAEYNKHPFIATQGDHVTAVKRIAPDLSRSITDFLKRIDRN